MSNTLLNISMITKEALRVLKTQIGFAAGVNRQYDNQFAVKGAKIGDTINIRKPPKFTVSDGATLDVQDVTESSVALQLDSQKHVDFQFTSKELTLNIDMFSERYIKPAIAALAAKIDFDGLALYKNIYNAVGTAGTAPSSLETPLKANAYLTRGGAPSVDRSCVLNAESMATMVNGISGKFQDANEISKQYKKGVMGIAAGMLFREDEHPSSHTVGTYAGTPLVNGASQSGASLVTDGWSSTSLKEGDVFTIAGVYSVNPQTKQSTGVLQQFVVTADVSDVAGDMTIAISPSIVTSGSGQTVSGSPADGAAITLAGASGTVSPQNMAYHKDAFALGMADLEIPNGVDMAARAVDPDSGFSVRIVRQYDISNDRSPCRIDVLYGWKVLYADLACRIYS